jgi:hypothetical protein
VPFTTRGVGVNLVDDNGVLTVPLAYQGSVEHFVVPSGFYTDFASVPRLFRSLFPSIGKWTQAAVLHDWFCVHLASGDCLVSSRDADGIFRRVMREAGVGFVTRWQMWAGVRWGALFNRHRRPGIARDLPLVGVITLLDLAAVVAVVAGLHILIDLI